VVHPGLVSLRIVGRIRAEREPQVSAVRAVIAVDKSLRHSRHQPLYALLLCVVILLHARLLAGIKPQVVQPVGFFLLPRQVERLALVESTGVRARLARQLCHANLAAGGYLPLLALSPSWEQAFAESIVGQGEERQLAMAPSQLQQFIQTVRERFDEAGSKNEVPVLLTSPQVRPFVRSIIERFRSQTVVMSQNEIHATVRLRTLGQI